MLRYLDWSALWLIGCFCADIQEKPDILDFFGIVILVELDVLGASLSRLVSLVADRMFLCGYTGKA